MTAPLRNDASGLPIYEQVKDYIREQILSGAWPIDHRVPSENALVGEFGASRMTVNRAVRELTDEGWLRRVQGQGTFVSDTRTSINLLEIRNIAEVIRARGAYTNMQLVHATENADPVIAEALDLAEGTEVFHTRMVHFLDGAPFQLEDRYVNPAAAPDYLEIDLSRQTPNEYLMHAAPLSEVEHRLEAVLPTADQQKDLKVGPDQPCLLLHRRTWSGERVASRAWLTHPGDRFYLSTRFSYGNGKPSDRISLRPL
jgi:GntR family histidine utilization transcriptional repressor